MDLNSRRTSSPSMYFYVHIYFPGHVLNQMLCRYVAVMNSIFSAQRSMVLHEVLYYLSDFNLDSLAVSFYCDYF
jgi:hypothetical protein